MAPSDRDLVTRNRNAGAVTGPTLSGRVGRPSRISAGDLIDRLLDMNRQVGRIPGQLESTAAETVAAVEGNGQAVLNRLAEIGDSSSLHLQQVNDDVLRRIETLSADIERDMRVQGEGNENRFQALKNGIESHFREQTQGIESDFQKLDNLNSGYKNDLHDSMVQQLAPLHVAIEDIKRQQAVQSENIGRLTDSMTKSLELSEKFLNRATLAEERANQAEQRANQAEHRANQAHAETRRMLDAAQKTLIEFRAEGKNITAEMGTLVDRQAESSAAMTGLVQQSRRETALTTQVPGTAPGHVAQMAARLNSMSVSGEEPSISGHTSSAVQADGAIVPAHFSSEKWVGLNVPAHNVEAAKALGIEERDNEFKPGTKRYTVRPGTDLMPLKEYWTDRLQNDYNLDVVNRLARPASTFGLSFVSTDAAAKADLSVPEKGLLVSEKWHTLIVPPDKVAAAKALGVHEYPNKYKVGELRYTVPPGTDLMPLRAYWSDATQREFSTLKGRERSSSVR